MPYLSTELQRLNKAKITNQKKWCPKFKKNVYKMLVTKGLMIYLKKSNTTKVIFLKYKKAFQTNLQKDSLSKKYSFKTFFFLCIYFNVFMYLFIFSFLIIGKNYSFCYLSFLRLLLVSFLTVFKIAFLKL